MTSVVIMVRFNIVQPMVFMEVASFVLGCCITHPSMQPLPPRTRISFPCTCHTSTAPRTT